MDKKNKSIKLLGIMILVSLGFAEMVGAQPAVLAGPVTNPANGHNYYLLGRSTWTEAEAAAVDLGGHLVTIDNADENQWVYNIFNFVAPVGIGGLWIGLNDAAAEGAFGWTSGEPITYLNWSAGLPIDLGEEDYVVMWKKAGAEGQWNDTRNDNWNFLDDYPTYGVVEVDSTLLPVIYHVDKVIGNDGNDGLSRDTAFATIPRGIIQADNGDIIRVWPGMYQGPVNFSGKAITICSAADAAVITYPGSTAVFFTSGEGPGSVLKNFVIRGSVTGILADGSTPTISHVTVVKNQYGIVATDGAAPAVSNSIFWANENQDVSGCGVTYSCLKGGHVGEGNISGQPEFVDSGANDFHLRSERGRYEPTDPQLGQWSAARALDELDDGAYTAKGPHRSEDGLTMYFFRYIPDLGRNQIVKAQRFTTDELFGSEQIVSGIDIAGTDIESPWVSADELRLYYHEFTTAGFKIKMAKRQKKGDPWYPARTFNELHIDGYHDLSVSLTEDEKIIFFGSNRPGGPGINDIWTARRDEPNGLFTDLSLVNEVNTEVNESGTFIMPDGLTLYFHRAPRGARTSTDIFRAKRSSLNEPFTAINQVKMPGMWQNNPYVSPDESNIYYQDESGGVDFGIYMIQQRKGQWILDEVTSPCIDAGDPTLNPMAEPMPNGARLNLGAYGGTEYASLSEWPIAGDVNRDGVFNLIDFSILSSEWLLSVLWLDK